RQVPHQPVDVRFLPVEQCRQLAVVQQHIAGKDVVVGNANSLWRSSGGCFTWRTTDRSLLSRKTSFA
ncbi:MAG TPA: hypothetical protein VJ301_15825, partial [Propionibacteriaceae bacterium]|nr:hypothetical protein [Propionibacteriaceae bacterium]